MAVELEKVTQAVNAVKQVSSVDTREAKNLFDDDNNSVVYLFISLKKIPYLQHLQTHRITLPHPVVVDLKEVCLLTIDLDKRKPDDDQSVLHFTQLLSNKGISIGQVIPYHMLKTEYKTYEARRHLARSYQTFLNDGRITKMLPVALGSFFIRKKKMPTSISLNPDKVRNEFKKVMSKTTLMLSGRGSSCVVKVGILTQETDELVENIVAVAKYIEDKFPGKWANIQSLHLKTQFSISVPVYISTESPNDVVLPARERPAAPIEDEISTLTRSRVRVFPSGQVTLVKTESSGVSNEYEDTEKRLLRTRKNEVTELKQKRKRRNDRIEAKETKRIGLSFKPKTEIRDKDLKKKEAIKEVPAIKSIFGFSQDGKTVAKVPTRKQKKTESLDKSFEDSFQIQKQKKTLKSGSLQKTTSVETVQEKENNIMQASTGRRMRLRKSKSYALNKDVPLKNECSELLSYIKKDCASPGIKAEKLIKVEKGVEKKRQVKVKQERGLSHFQSLRQSKRMAKKML